jgi:hypothetical protein
VARLLQERKDSCYLTLFIENGPAPGYKEEKEAEALDAAEKFEAEELGTTRADDNASAARFAQTIKKFATTMNAALVSKSATLLIAEEADTACKADYFNRASAALDASEDREARDSLSNDMLDDYAAKFPRAAEKFREVLRWAEKNKGALAV